MMRRRKAIVWALGSLLGVKGAIPAWGAETAPFLTITPSARGVAMADAFTAAVDDLGSLHYNPAGLSRLGGRQAGFSHAELFQGVRFDSLAYGQTGLGGAWGVGLLHLTQGSLDGRDAAGNPTGSFGASDTAAQLGYARRLPGGWGRAGLSVKYIESRLADAAARGVAFDLGYLRELGPASLGVSLLNVGPGLRYLDQTQSLPASVALGAALRVAGSLLLTADYRHRPDDGQGSFSMGTEYSMLPTVFLRGGYLSRLQSAPGAAAGGSPFGGQGLGLGLGLRLGQSSLDYSFSPYGELGNAQRISLATRF